MLKERHKAVLRVYSRLHEHRRQWFSSNMRFAAMIACVILITLVYNYFEASYAVAITEASGRVVTVSSLLFNAFIAGAIFGIAVFLVVAEGEYILGIRRHVYSQLDEKGRPRKAARGKRR